MNKNLFLKGVYIVILFILSSCITGKRVKENVPVNLVIYPSPPDTTRIQFLTRISNSTDITGNRNWFVKFLLGEDKAMPIIKPYGIAIHKGKIYVCDKNAGGLAIIDLEKSAFDYFIPTGKGQLKMPVSCFVDTNGFLYVADAGRLQIVVFDDNGNYVNCFGEAKNFKPTDLFIYDNKIWVANMIGHKIHVYSKDSVNKLRYSFTESEPGNHDYLYSPTNLFVTNDKVYVTDFGDFIPDLSLIICNCAIQLTSELGGMSVVTKAWAPILLLEPIVTGPNILALLQTITLSPMVGCRFLLLNDLLAS